MSERLFGPSVVGEHRALDEPAPATVEVELVPEPVAPAPATAPGWLGYVRVSTEEQLASIDAQRQAIESECARRGWTLSGFRMDHGYSAKNLDRPGIMEALELLARRRSSGLIVARLDRLSRSVLDFAALLDRATREGWSLVCLDCPVDTTTPAGEAMAGVLSIFAQFERRLISQRTREGMAARKAAGVRFGAPPKITGEVEALIVELRGRGLSLEAIGRELDARGVATVGGGRRWYASTIKTALDRVARAARAAS